MATENKNHKAPFFIVGVQRSGTTLLSVMLDKHPNILMEKKAISFRIITCFKNLYDLLPLNIQHDRKRFTAWLIENDINGELAQLIDFKNIESYDTIRDLIQGSIDKKIQQEKKMIWGDKSPNLQHYLNDLMLLMPTAKILHIVRDGRANAYSMSTRSYRNLSLSAQLWVDGNIFGMVNQQILGKQNYKLIQYEKLLKDPEGEARVICDFLEIPYASEMLNLSEARLEKKESYVSNFFDRSKIDKWKTQLSAKELKAIENIQAPLLRKFGYELRTPSQDLNLKYLDIKQRIWYNQVDNFKQLFRRRRIGMSNKEFIELDVPLKKRIYTFLRFLCQDLLSAPIFKSFFSRFFYTKKIFDEKIKS